MTQTSQPTFKGFLQASGHAKALDSKVEQKFQQLNWGTTTNEGCYSTNILIGNWNEDKFDIKEMAKSKQLPSQFDHYFETTYGASYLKNDKKMNNVQEILKSTNKVSRSFPGHQPELDSNQLKQTYNTYLSCSQDAYRPHN